MKTSHRLFPSLLALALGVMGCEMQAPSAPQPLFAVAGDDGSPAVFLNELHYDNVGSDAGEAVEIAGPAGTDLTGWRVVLYNGSSGAVYGSATVSGATGDLCNGFGVVALDGFSSIQNGAPDGVALVDAGNTVVQFLSYEGTLTATDGPAAGLTSTDLGVAESGETTPVGASLQLSGTGATYADFAWEADQASSFGACNAGQVFEVGPPDEPPPDLPPDDPPPDDPVPPDPPDEVGDRLTVEIDIRPAGERNAINPRSRGLLPVAILGSATFDVAIVDRTTLAFGPKGATPVHQSLGHLKDVNRDGLIDLLSHYRIRRTGIAKGDTEACLTGHTLDGTAFEACDTVTVRKKRKGRTR